MSFAWAKPYEPKTGAGPLDRRAPAAAAPGLRRHRRRLSGAAQPQLLLELRGPQPGCSWSSRSSPASSWRCIITPPSTAPSIRSSTSCATSTPAGCCATPTPTAPASSSSSSTSTSSAACYYGSYKAPREMVWMLGLVIYLLMMATAFMGYVLPWGQMSYWGAQVITGFFSAIPVVGEPIRVWLLGGFAPDQAALTRFFSLHYLLPFVIAGVTILHIWALHIPGSGNPTGVDVKNEKDTLPFHPFYTAKDGWFAGAVLIAYCAVMFFAPERARPPGQLHPGQPAGDAGAHRSRNGISGRSTRSCAPSPSTSSCRPSCGACWRCSPRSCCCSSCPGWTSRRSARAITARCSSASSGC